MFPTVIVSTTIWGPSLRVELTDCLDKHAALSPVLQNVLKRDDTEGVGACDWLTISSLGAFANSQVHVPNLAAVPLLPDVAESLVSPQLEVLQCRPRLFVSHWTFQQPDEHRQILSLDGAGWGHWCILREGDGVDGTRATTPVVLPPRKGLRQLQ